MKEPYPIYLVLKDKPVVVVGGGIVAERKITGLLHTGAHITVIAPRATRKIRALANNGLLELKQRNMDESDLEGKPVVFVATDSDEVNRSVSALARKGGALVNCVDTPDACDFFVPSSFRRGSLSIAISTGGKIPALAKRMREKLQAIVGEEYAAYVEVLARGRERIIKGTPGDYKKRKELIERLLDADVVSLLREGKKEEAVGVIESVLQQSCERCRPEKD